MPTTVRAMKIFTFLTLLLPSLVLTIPQIRLQTTTIRPFRPSELQGAFVIALSSKATSKCPVGMIYSLQPQPQGGNTFEIPHNSITHQTEQLQREACKGEPDTAFMQVFPGDAAKSNKQIQAVLDSEPAFKSLFSDIVGNKDYTVGFEPEGRECQFVDLPANTLLGFLDRAPTKDELPASIGDKIPDSPPAMEPSFMVIALPPDEVCVYFGAPRGTGAQGPLAPPGIGPGMGPGMGPGPGGAPSISEPGPGGNGTAPSSADTGNDASASAAVTGGGGDSSDAAGGTSGTPEADSSTEQSDTSAAGSEDTTSTGTEEPAPSPTDEAACFPASATVQLEDGSSKTMDEIDIGDNVNVGNDVYSDVFMFTHRHSDVEYDFVKLSSTDGDSLTATSGHYIYVNGHLIAAREARVGDTLERASGGKTVIVSIDIVRAKGLYNPQTVDGDIVVDGFRASTYTTAVEPSVAGGLLAPLKALHRFGFKLDTISRMFDEGVSGLVQFAPKGLSSYA